MKISVFILFTLFCLSCNRDGVEKPEHLLNEDEMVNIMYDMSLIQAMASTSPAVLDSAKVDPKTYIYKKYSIDSVTLVQNQRYYIADIENYQKLHKKVSEKLISVKAPLDSLTKKKRVNTEKKLSEKAAKLKISEQ